MSLIEIENISKSYGKKQAIKDFSVVFEPGVYGLVGPNGAGKTTLMKILAGIMQADSGEIKFREKNIKFMGSEYFRHISYMPQEFGFYPFYTALDTLDYFRILKDAGNDKESLEKLLEIVNLSENKKNKVRTFSGGMKRRLGIAVTLLGNPDFLIFDEPTAGLDPEERIRFKKIIKEISKEKGVLISTHILSDVEALCNKICFMDNGRLVKIIDGIDIGERLTDKLEDEYLEMFRKDDEKNTEI